MHSTCSSRLTSGTPPNRYECSSCNSKQDAQRAIRLTKLPNVLSFHLLRFVFDQKTWEKKKLNNTLTFPTELDMVSRALRCHFAV